MGDGVKDPTSSFMPSLTQTSLVREPLIGSTKKLEEFCTRYMIGRLYNAC